MSNWLDREAMLNLARLSVERHRRKQRLMLPDDAFLVAVDALLDAGILPEEAGPIAGEVANNLAAQKEAKSAKRV